MSPLSNLFLLLIAVIYLLAVNRAQSHDLLDWLTWIILAADVVIKALDYYDNHNREP